MAEEFVNDISSLDIDPPNEDYWGEYQDAATRRVTPPEGNYFLRMPEVFGYARTQTGGLKVLMDPLVIVGGEFDGSVIRFATVSTTKFKNTNASSAADVLRNFYTSYGADGKAVYTGPSPSTKEEWAEALRAIAGQVTPHPVYCQRVGWDKVEKKEYKGAKSFPKGDDGHPQDFIDLPNPDGGTRRVFANLRPSLRGFSVTETLKQAA